MSSLLGFAATSIALAAASTHNSSRPAALPFPDLPDRPVAAEVMQHVHDELATPFKYGVVLAGEDGEILDCPNIFRSGDRWYMMYVSNKNETGYETHLARSDDLLHWEKLGAILTFREKGWDAWQADGGIALYDTRWDGTHSLSQFEGRFWLSYIGGAQHGYEPDPLAIGLAHTDDPAAVAEWTRIPENPVLSPAQSDARPFETTTLYKSAVIRDDTESLGYPFVMFYNAKCPPDGHETIGIAVSRDLRSWTRLGPGPVIANEGQSRWSISGDPQIIKIDDLWVMVYFGAFWQPGAFDTFACSHDLVHWTKWTGTPLVSSSEPYDKKFAHKPWVLKHDGIVYHFYCAVGDQSRVIALATSKDLRAP